MHNMLAAVTAQEGSFRVAHMASVRLSTGRLVLRIDFDAPSPFGLRIGLATALNPQESHGVRAGQATE